MTYECSRCGSSQISIISGECYSCGVDSDNHWLHHIEIKNLKLKKGNRCVGKIINGSGNFNIIDGEGNLIHQENL